MVEKKFLRVGNGLIVPYFIDDVLRERLNDIELPDGFLLQDGLPEDVAMPLLPFVAMARAKGYAGLGKEGYRLIKSAVCDECSPFTSMMRFADLGNLVNDGYVRRSFVDRELVYFPDSAFARAKK